MVKKTYEGDLYKVVGPTKEFTQKNKTVDSNEKLQGGFPVLGEADLMN